ncbi:MAG: PAS domain S-box protein [Thermodesulfobacteriota bacterium]
MKKEDETIEKLLTIEKAVNEMVALRPQILELKESETQRQMTMEALCASENKYRILVENLPQKLFLKDKNSVCIFCNQNFAADLKIKPEDISGKTDYDFFPKELAEKYISDDKRILATGQLESIEEKYVHEGQTSIVHTVKTPVKDEKEETVGILGIFWDITEQKRNEEELKKNCAHLEELVSNRTAELQTVDKQLQREITECRRVGEQRQEAEGMFRTLLENTGTATVMIEENMIISLANTGFEKLSGYSKEEVEGKKSWREFVAKDDLERTKEYDLARNANPGAVPGNYEYRFLDKKGNIRDILVTIAMIPETKKRVLSSLDITDHKRTKESLRTLEERYDTLVENANEAILVVQDGILRFVSPRICDILGYAKDDLTCKLFKEFIHPEDREIVESHAKKLQDEDPFHVYSFRMIHKEGNSRWLENRVALIQWEKSPAALNVMTDITDRRQAEEELRNSIEPFRELVNATEKILLPLNRE